MQQSEGLLGGVADTFLRGERYAICYECANQYCSGTRRWRPYDEKDTWGARLVVARDPLPVGDLIATVLSNSRRPPADVPRELLGVVKWGFRPRAID